MYKNMALILLLSVSVSLDTLGIGMSYAIEKIRIPWQTKIIVALTNMVLTFFTVLLARYLNDFMPDFWISLFGGCVLLALGGKTLWNALGENKTADYDRDDSHVLELAEGCALGVTMALDAVSAGLGLGNLGPVAYLFPIVTAFSGLLFLSLGAVLGGSTRRLNGAGGVILILLGLFRIFY